jgi:hypothetical protein
MNIFLQHGWILFIIVNIINHFAAKNRVEKYIVQNPELQSGYDQLFKGILILGNIPWLIMGMADLTGYTQTIFDFFRPKEMNPFVLAFHIYMLTILLLFARWIYFKKGAEFLMQHPGIITLKGMSETSNPTAAEIKRFLAFSLLGGFAALIVMWVANFPGIPIK